MRLAAGALAALLVSRLLPESGVGLYLRLAAATAVALLPGLLVASTASGALVWALAAVAAGLAAAVLLHTGFWLLVVVWAVAAIAAAPLGRRLHVDAVPLLAGILLGIALWWVGGGIEGDALFHLARIRKLLELDSLSLTGLGEFADGGLHPGYAFPLWHAFLGLIAWLAGVDPSLAVLHGASVLAPVAVLVSYEAGVALFRSAWAGGAVALAQVGMIALAPGGGGAYRVLELPATASRQLLVPAALTLIFLAVRAPGRRAWASVAAAAFALAVAHPTYALFLLVPLAGFLVARWLLTRRDVRELGLALAAFALPTAAVAAVLYPIARTTASYMPGEETSLGARHGVLRYAGQLDVFSDGSFRLAPELLARTGAIAVAALVLVPLAGLAGRRRWAAFVLGGSLAVLVLVLVPALFSSFADVVSLSQARRVAGFLPFAFAFAGGAAVLTALLGPFLLPVALGAGIGLQLAYPGEFGYVFEGGPPALAAWVALFGGLAALAVGAVRAGRLAREGSVVLGAAVLFVLPVGVHAAADWEHAGSTRSPLPEALVERLGERDVVLSDVETSYRLMAQAPVYVVAAPPAHVADTTDNRPYERRRTVRRFLRTGDLEIARRTHADWILIDERHFHPPLELEPAWEDGRYALYSVP